MIFGATIHSRNNYERQMILSHDFPCSLITLIFALLLGSLLFQPTTLSSATWIYAVNLNEYKVSTPISLPVGSSHSFFLVVLQLVLLRASRELLFFLSFSVLKKNHTFVMWLKSFNLIALLSLVWAKILSPHLILIINSDQDLYFLSNKNRKVDHIFKEKVVHINGRNLEKIKGSFRFKVLRSTVLPLSSLFFPL